MLKNQEVITTIYKSRLNILDIMEYNGYNIERYKGFTTNEIHEMINQLDMILETKDTTNPKKVYIRYFLDKENLNTQLIDNIVEELFEVSETLNKDTDTLYFISKSKPTDSITAKLKNIWAIKGILVVVEHIKQLQFNILKHEYVPNPILLTPKEVEELNKKYEYEHLAVLNRFDPVARAICLRPGQVVKFMRPSETAILTPFYRRCVEQ